MSQLFQLVLGAIAFLAMLSSFILYKKWRLWKLVLFFVVAFGFVWIWTPLAIIIPDAPVWFVEYYPYVLLFVMSLFLITLRRKVKITQNLTDYDFFEMEKELDEMKSTSELLRLRFISTIDLLHEGLLFYNEDGTDVFLTEQACSILGRTEHTVTIENYIEGIHPEDRSSYVQTIKKMSKKHPQLDLKYRVKRESFYVWIEEKVKIFEFDKKQHLISTIQGIDMKLFPITLIHELDSLPTESHLVQALTQIAKEPETFYLVMIQLTNIVDINQRFGRDVGNLMIAEYIKKIRFHFTKDINSIFRITGIQFALLIREQRKYEVLIRALQSGGDLVNLPMNIGGINQVVYPNLGIVKHEPWSSYNIGDFITMGNKALEEAIRNPKRNYAIFGE